MRTLVICAVMMALVSTIAGLTGAAVAQVFNSANSELITALAVGFVGCPLGFVWGLQLATFGRQELLNRVFESERVLVILSVISAFGCSVGMLGDGRPIPAAIGIVATIGSLVAAGFVLLHDTPNTRQRHASPDGRLRR